MSQYVVGVEFTATHHALMSVRRRKCYRVLSPHPTVNKYRCICALDRAQPSTENHPHSLRAIAAFYVWRTITLNNHVESNRQMLSTEKICKDKTWKLRARRTSVGSSDFGYAKGPSPNGGSPRSHSKLREGRIGEQDVSSYREMPRQLKLNVNPRRANQILRAALILFAGRHIWEIRIFSVMHRWT